MASAIEGADIQAGVYVTANVLKMQLDFLKTHFQVVSLSDFQALFKKGSFSGIEKPLCLLTFDDGWLDFYANAFPTLRDAGVPATVFLPTGYIGTDRQFWTDRLAYLLTECVKKNCPNNRNHFSATDMVDRLIAMKGDFHSRLEEAIALLKGFRAERIEAVLGGLAERLEVNWPEQKRAFISWEEAREMGQSGLVEFGSHTVNHPILSTLAPGEISAELVQSRNKLIEEGVCRGDSLAFCYPNGNYTPSISEMVKEAGYSMAVTTKGGWNSPNSDPYTLRRVGIHQDMTSTEGLFGCRLAGIF
jgi:peptidoglycan/xylan/chitin deacetylase (PgdA/CDA1 family)